MVSTSKRERWREFVAKREKEDLSPNVSSITDDYVDEYSDVEQKGLDDVENDQFLQQEEEEEAALQKGKLFVRKILNKRKNKEKITESNSWEDNSLCRFLGEAISVDEARRRWPFRYEKKDGKEEEVMIARRHFSQALVHGCVYNLYDDVHVQSLRLVMEYLRCYLHLEIHILGEMTLTRVVDWLALSSKRDEGIDLLKDKQALQRLTETAEKAKMELSSLTQANISLSFITATADGPKHIETTLTRAKFEELCSDLLDRYMTLYLLECDTPYCVCV